MSINDAPVLLFSNDAKKENFHVAGVISDLEEESNILVFKYDRNPNLNYKLAEEIIQENSFSMEYLKNTNVLYFDGKQYTLDFNEKYPIKINYLDGSESTDGGSDGPLLSVVNGYRRDTTVGFFRPPNRVIFKILDDNDTLGIIGDPGKGYDWSSATRALLAVAPTPTDRSADQISKDGVVENPDATEQKNNIYVYKRRQLEIRHRSANNDILTLVVPFKSNKYHKLTFIPENTETNEESYLESELMNTEANPELPINGSEFENTIATNGLNLMDIIPKSDYYYYDKANGEKVIFFNERTIDEEKAPELFDGTLRGEQQIVSQQSATNQKSFDWNSSRYTDEGNERLQLFNNFYPGNTETIYDTITVSTADPPYLGPWYLSADIGDMVTVLDRGADSRVKYVSSGTYYNDYYITAFIVNTIDYNMNRETEADTARVNAGELPETYFDCQPVGASDEKILNGIYKDKYINLDETINKKANNIFSNIGSFFTSATSSIPGLGRYINPKRKRKRKRRRRRSDAVSSGFTGKLTGRNDSNVSKRSKTNLVGAKTGFTSKRINSYSLREGINEEPSKILGYEESDNIALFKGNNLSHIDHSVPQNTSDYYFDDEIKRLNMNVNNKEDFTSKNRNFKEGLGDNFNKWIKADCDNFSQVPVYQLEKSADATGRVVDERHPLARAYYNGITDEEFREQLDVNPGVYGPNTATKIRKSAISTRKMCLKEPRCRIKKETREDRKGFYKLYTKAGFAFEYIDVSGTDLEDENLKDDPTYLDMYDVGWTSNPQVDKIFRCEEKILNPISRLYLAIRNYIRITLRTIYISRVPTIIGLTIGFAIVISFNVLLNKILDKKKPKKNRDTSLNGSI